MAADRSILTGTPGGVGYRRQPPLALKAGDIVVVEIDHIGRIESTIVGERVPASPEPASVTA